MNSTNTIAMRPLLFPDDQQFRYETPRALGYTAYGGADFAEVVTTAARTSAGDDGSWHEQWAAMSSGRRPTHNLTRNGGGLDGTEGFSMDRLVDETAGQRT
jgi:hypothetical protein